ncbi:hypothetical protein BN2537_2869 [Streptomyces venezuelae]|nr:hypothetical protein BN2537_2869 [Streptomyces venezuelae]
MFQPESDLASIRVPVAVKHSALVVVTSSSATSRSPHTHAVGVCD